MPATRRTVLAATAAGLAGLAATAGCSGQPGTVGWVDGERISEGGVDRLRDAIGAVLGGGVGRALTVEVLVLGGVARGLVRRGHSVDGRARALMAAGSPQLGSLLGDPRTQAPVARWVDFEVLRRTMPSGELGAELTRVDVRLDPRYGEVAKVDDDYVVTGLVDPTTGAMSVAPW